MTDEVPTEVGRELLFENDRIRVWDMVLGPGEESPVHRHLADYVFIYTTPSRVVAYHEGSPASENTFDDGYVQYTEVGPGLVPHRIRNVADRVHRQIIVELKGPSASLTPRKPEDNRRRTST
jgi:predicted metal-dependent enzyme (double-stranded beta helix superfamily)